MLRVFGGYVLLESREEALALGCHCPEQTRPVALPGEIDRRTLTGWEPRFRRFDLDRGLGLIDTDYRGVQPPLFLTSS